MTARCQRRGRTRVPKVMYRSRLGSVTPSAKLPPDGKPQLAIGGIIAERVVRFPNGGERLIHRCQRLRFIYSRLGILRGHRAPSRRERDLPLSATNACGGALTGDCLSVRASCVINKASQRSSD